MVKLGINGFGRLGRQLLKVVLKKCKQKTSSELPKVVMINDANISAECLGYLIKNDSFYGKFCGEIVEMADSITIDGLRIEISKEAAAEKIPWSKAGVEYVIDTSGKNTSCAAASKFLTAGIKRVIVSGCSNIPMFVVGVNHACFWKEMKTVSAATPCMNCLTPMLRVVHENFEIAGAMATVIHPLTSSDLIMDEIRGSHCRRSRSAVYNFGPTFCLITKKNIDKIMPELEGLVQSAAIKVPVPCVGAVDLSFKMKKEASVEAIKCKFKEAAETYMKDIVDFTDSEAVSSDIIGNPNSCVFDAKATIALSNCVAKIFAWYDAEYGFANRLYDLANYIYSREGCK